MKADIDTLKIAALVVVVTWGVISLLRVLYPGVGEWIYEKITLIWNATAESCCRARVVTSKSRDENRNPDVIRARQKTKLDISPDQQREEGKRLAGSNFDYGFNNGGGTMQRSSKFDISNPLAKRPLASFMEINDDEVDDDNQSVEV